MLLQRLMPAVVGLSMLVMAPVVIAEDYESFTLAPGFQPDPTIGTGAIGGPRLASEATGVTNTETGQCSGYIDTLPDHQITLTADFEYLEIAAVSSARTSLVILGPNGEAWCNTGENPSIYGFYESGSYDVYVGNMRRDVGARYELFITELR